MSEQVPRPVVRAWAAEHHDWHHHMTVEQRDAAAATWSRTRSDDELLRLWGMGPVGLRRIRATAPSVIADRIQRMAAGYFG